MKKLIIIPIILACSVANATPTVSDVSDSITGSGFGTKLSAAPVAYDNFESGTPGNDLSVPTIGATWTFLNSGTATTNTKYSSSYSSNGNQSAVCEWTNGGLQTICSFGKAGIFNPSTQTVYLYYKRYMIPSEIPIADCNVKQWYLFGDGHRAADNASDYPQGMVNIQAGESEWGYLSNAPGGVIYGYDTEMLFSATNNTWQAWEIYTKINTVGASDGIIHISVDGDMKHTVTDYSYAQSDGLFDDIRIGNMYSMNEDPDTGGSEKAYCYYDEVYIDNTPQRVLVTKNADGTGDREIQPYIQSWSDTEIVLSAWNQGSFEDYESCYLFVCDEYGGVSDGLEGYFVDGVFYSGCYGCSINISGSLTITNITME